MKTFVLGLVVALVAMLASSHANAQPVTGVAWSSTASGCNPSLAATNGDLYLTDRSSVEFSTTNNSTPFTFVCPITRGGFFYAPTLRLFYSDSDGSGANALIYAQIRRRNKANGSTNTMCTARSNKLGTIARSTCDFGAYGTMDAQYYLYWVEVTLSRTSRAYRPIFHGVDIYFQPE
jgi:hypothetical protein